jgi:hypothetical protein
VVSGRHSGRKDRRAERRFRVVLVDSISQRHQRIPATNGPAPATALMTPPSEAASAGRRPSPVLSTNLTLRWATSYMAEV